MIVAIVLSIVALAALVAAAVWDLGTRALASQTRRAELAVEREERRDLVQLAADVEALRAEVRSLTTAQTIGRRR